MPRIAMLDSTIPLQVQPAKIDSPITSIGALMQLRGQASEIALRQAQAATQRQQAELVDAEQQQKNRDLADQNTIQALEKDPATYAALHRGDFTALAGKVQPKTIQATQKFVNEAIEKQATLDTARLTQNDLAHKEINRTLDSFSQMKKPDGTLDIDRINESLPGAIQGLSKELGLIGIDANQLPKAIHSPEDFQKIAGQSSALAALNEAALKRKGEQVKIEQDQASARSATATAADKEFDLKLKQGFLDGTQDALIDARFAGHPDAAAAAKAAAKQTIAGGTDKAIEAVNTVYANTIGAAQRIASETPAKVAEQAAMLPGEVRKAAATSQAEIPARVAGAVQTQKALAAMSPDAFAGITDASSRHTAQTDLDKIATSYTDTAIGAQRLLDTINAAKAGNKAAPAAVIIEQARSLIGNNRLNQQELKNVSVQAGSLMDKLEGFIGKHTEGQPIPPDILRDTAALANITKMAAERSWNAGLQRLGDRGVDTSKIKKPTIESAPTIIRARDPQGNLHEAPAGTPLPAGWKAE